MNTIFIEIFESGNNIKYSATMIEKRELHETYKINGENAFQTKIRKNQDGSWAEFKPVGKANPTKNRVSVSKKNLEKNEVYDDGVGINKQPWEVTELAGLIGKKIDLLNNKS